MLKNKKNNAAFTLIEILLVVAFVVIAAAGVYITYEKTDTANKVEEEALNIATIRVGIKRIYGNSNYNSVSNSSLILAKVVPDKLVVNSTTIGNNFNGNINVTPASVGTGTNNAFEIETTQVPKSMCAHIASSLNYHFDVVVINATVIKDKTSVPQVPFSVSAATTACANNLNIIKFRNI